MVLVVWQSQNVKPRTNTHAPLPPVPPDRRCKKKTLRLAAQAYVRLFFFFFQPVSWGPTFHHDTGSHKVTHLFFIYLFLELYCLVAAHREQWKCAARFHTKAMNDLDDSHTQTNHKWRPKKKPIFLRPYKQVRTWTVTRRKHLLFSQLQSPSTLLYKR